MAGPPQQMPFTSPNHSNRLLYHADVESQVHDYRMPQHHGNQQGPPANLSYDYQDTLISEQSPDFQLFNQPSYVTEVGNPGVATETDLIPTHHQLSQEVEQSLTDPSYSAPEIETLTDDYPSAFYTAPVHDNILPKGSYAHYTESQPAQYEMAPYANMSLDPGHSSSSQLATFPTSQCQSSFKRGPRARVSDDLFPEQCLSQGQVSKEPTGDIQSEYIPRCQLPAQSGVLRNPALLPDAQIDSNWPQAMIPRVPTPEFSESLKSLPATGGVLAKLGAKASQRNMHRAKAAKKGSQKALWCPFCPKWYQYPGEYKRHLKIHTRERPYKCAWRDCTKTFPRKDNQERHTKKCKHKPAASVTSDGVDEGIYSFSQGQSPPDPGLPSLLGGKDYPDTSTNWDNGHALVDGGINNALQLTQTSIDSANARNDENCQLTSSDPSKAVLKITGDLKSMGENWSEQDKAKHRRIVVFHRTRKGSTLNTTFELSSINSQSDGGGRVSCILWAAKGEFYITSCEIILLVEYLVDTKKPFSLPERNLIRSTLSKLDPTTVSEKDPWSQDFHKIIMGFSDPQPVAVRKNSVRVHPWNKLESALKTIVKLYGFSLGSTREKLQPPRYLMPRPQILNSTSLHMGLSHHAPLSSASFTGFLSSVDQAPPAEDAHETLQQDCVPRVEAAAPSSANANRIYSDTGERPLKYQEMDCNRISQPQTYLTHLQGTQNFPSTPELELPVLSTSNIIREVHSEIPHQARPDPDSNLTSPKSESSLPETFIHDESDSDSAEGTIVVGARPGQDKQNAPTLPVDKHIDGVDFTYKDNEEKARGSKPSVTYDDDDWGYAIADGKITIHCKNTLLTNFDREVPVRGMCPGVQRILDRIHELFLKGDIKEQQEVEAESEQIHIKGRTRPMTQRNISFSENTEQQQSSEVTYATIDELQKMLPESKGLDLSRISKSELDVILKAVQEVLNTIQQVLITSWIEEAEPAKQLLDEFQCYCTYEWH
ncbi:hypothetical protein FOWG_17238 [Fusarium oxysporum f. sp. lycopersici MN25]|nr:hypothetical protein FOWG_17238 [Fusarium oxysporum f. sp. lycopersici MN25]EWZ78546.1 hypothetical protein FOWG_17238 [Fusarium oxysporum f. sp. lycopersici MN25]